MSSGSYQNPASRPLRTGSVPLSPGFPPTSNQPDAWQQIGAGLERAGKTLAKTAEDESEIVRFNMAATALRQEARERIDAGDDPEEVVGDFEKAMEKLRGSVTTPAGARVARQSLDDSKQFSASLSAANDIVKAQNLAEDRKAQNLVLESTAEKLLGRKQRGEATAADALEANNIIHFLVGVKLGRDDEEGARELVRGAYYAMLDNMEPDKALKRIQNLRKGIIKDETVLIGNGWSVRYNPGDGPGRAVSTFWIGIESDEDGRRSPTQNVIDMANRIKNMTTVENLLEKDDISIEDYMERFDTKTVTLPHWRPEQVEAIAFDLQEQLWKCEYEGKDMETCQAELEAEANKGIADLQNTTDMTSAQGATQYEEKLSFLVIHRRLMRAKEVSRVIPLIPTVNGVVPPAALVAEVRNNPDLDVREVTERFYARNPEAAAHSGTLRHNIAWTNIVGNIRHYAYAPTLYRDDFDALDSWTQDLIEVMRLEQRVGITSPALDNVRGWIAGLLLGRENNIFNIGQRLFFGERIRSLGNQRLAEFDELLFKLDDDIRRGVKNTNEAVRLATERANAMLDGFKTMIENENTNLLRLPVASMDKVLPNMNSQTRMLYNKFFGSDPANLFSHVNSILATTMELLKRNPRNAELALLAANLQAISDQIGYGQREDGKDDE